MADEDRVKEPKLFGPDDNSYAAKVIRGEVLPECDTEVEKMDRIVYWQTASIDRTDKRIVIVSNGTNRRDYSVDDPVYQKVLESLLEKFPELEPGKVCKLHRYEGGRVEKQTVDVVQKYTEMKKEYD
ncbi:MAG: hypothetical protein K8F91_20030, partial [Candidatus Obscuribacterales bacterium]|nr:hypothetical protein [Candidatus Obscuribacterales bacterium]